MIEKLIKDLSDLSVLISAGESPICPYYKKTEHNDIGLCMNRDINNYKLLVRKENCYGSRATSKNAPMIYFACGYIIKIDTSYKK